MGSGTATPRRAATVGAAAARPRQAAAASTAWHQSPILATVEPCTGAAAHFEPDRGRAWCAFFFFFFFFFFWMVDFQSIRDQKVAISSWQTNGIG
jgi:hypothetical protein